MSDNSFSFREGGSARPEGVSDEEWTRRREATFDINVEEFMAGFRRKLLEGDASALAAIDMVMGKDPLNLQEREQEWLESERRREGLMYGERHAMVVELGIRITRRFMETFPKDPFIEGK